MIKGRDRCAEKKTQALQIHVDLCCVFNNRQTDRQIDRQIDRQTFYSFNNTREMY